jgi:[ribosomal protein S5]-alanine N-acetyltransferase
MTKMKDYILTTERCRLRRLSHGDAPHILSACQTPGFTDGMTWDPVRTIEETREFTDYALGMWEKGEKFVWTIEDKSDGTFIGRVEVGTVPEQPGNVWELGYFIHPSQQGKGYATEAAQEALRFAFEELQVDTVLSSHHDWNEASGKVLMKIGMKHTGFSEGRVMKNGKPVRAAEFWLDRVDWVPTSA